MYKDGRYINAGENEFYRYGREAVARVKAATVPNDAGFLSIAADGGKFWTFGTSMGKFGEYARFGDVCFSVNRAGRVWAKAGTEKAVAFVAAMEALADAMTARNAERVAEAEAADR